MKRLAVAGVLLLGMLTTLPADEENKTPNTAGSLGIGAHIGGGYNNGVSAKYWIDQENAIDAALSFASGDYEYTYFHADYLVHRFGLVNVEDGKIPLHFGLGVFTESSAMYSSDTVSTSGLRVPVGFSYLLKDAPLDLYMEVAPTVVSGDISGFYIAGSFGFRYYFE